MLMRYVAVMNNPRATGDTEFDALQDLQDALEVQFKESVEDAKDGIPEKYIKEVRILRITIELVEGPNT